MVVGVDKAGDDNVVLEVEHLVGGLRQIFCGPHCLNDTIARKQSAPRDFPPRAIHGDKNVGVADKQGGHGGKL